MSLYKKSFGSRLADLREQRNLLGKDVAAALHLSSQAYSQYENDRRTPELETALRLAQYYDVTLEYLIAGEGLFEDGIRPHLNESVTNLPPEAIDELLIFFDYLRYKYKSDNLYTSQE
ncbi:MAG: helix-turn-helix transcriptional regulator [Firmicutes bacterium]|nr:helix-turn-helix transcriptional regulator [Bacillota bacterium]